MFIYETVKDFMEATKELTGLNRSMMTIIGTPGTTEYRGQSSPIVSLKLVGICKQKNAFVVAGKQDTHDSYSVVVSRLDGTQPMRSYMSVKNAEYILSKAEGDREIETVTVQTGVFLARDVFAATDDSQRASLFSKTLKFIIKYKS